MMLPRANNDADHGMPIAWRVLLALGVIDLVRGSIHLFASDGGAGQIAGIDLTHGGDVIVMLFAVMGINQILWGVLNLLVSLRYRGFVPLMKQNYDAWQRHCAHGETRFNERGFDAWRSLFEGVLRGRSFRSVAKTFQVRVWQDLRRAWDTLAPDARARIEALLPSDLGLDRDAKGPDDSSPPPPRFASRAGVLLSTRMSVFRRTAIACKWGTPAVHAGNAPLRPSVDR